MKPIKITRYRVTYYNIYIKVYYNDIKINVIRK